ncbi:hypothetical protein HKX48_009505 [Thoreauomyces humboldtii]|nr:hypothetical protein HKX48_009505 [Thoreauomyces humboldtii]
MSSPDTYTVRCLSSDDEVIALLDHLEVVFGREGVPRGLFSDHYHRDVDTLDKLRNSFVAVTEDGQIVSSMRIYDRRIKLQTGSDAPIAAIGDVATHPNHLRRGLARRVIESGERHVLVQGTAALAILHTGSAKPLYEKLGYVCIPMRMGTILVPSITVPPSFVDGNEVVDFNDPDHVALMVRLHDRQAPPGSFKRSERYWKEWVASESSDTRLDVRRVLFRGRMDAREVGGYAFVDVAPTRKEMPTPARLHEFFAGYVDTCEELGPEETLGAMLHLVRTAFVVPFTDHSVEVAFPLALLPGLRSVAAFEEWEDLGWMFKFIADRSDVKGGHLRSLGDLRNALGDRYGFLKTDAF